MDIKRTNLNNRIKILPSQRHEGALQAEAQVGAVKELYFSIVSRMHKACVRATPNPINTRNKRRTTGLIFLKASRNLRPKDKEAQEKLMKNENKYFRELEASINSLGKRLSEASQDRKE